MKLEDMKARITRAFRLNAEAERVRQQIPLHMNPEIDRIARGLPRGGPHLYNKKGDGLAYFDQRPFVEGPDERKRIHPKYTQKDKRGQEIVVERHAEIRHNYYFWCSNKPTMNWKSENAPRTPREAAEIITYALAKHVARNDEQVGLLESGGMQRGHSVGAWLGTQLARDDSDRDMPRLNKMPARQSSAVLLSDFMTDDAPPETLYKNLGDTLARLRARAVSGWVVMVADPVTLDFSYKDAETFKGINDNSLEVSLGKSKRKEQQKEYKDLIDGHIRQLGQIARAHGFKFILQRTDEPLENALRAIYNLPPVPAATPSRTDRQP